MFYTHLRRFGGVLLISLLLVGCDENVFSGLDQQGTSDDPNVLLADAEAALAQGDTTQAIQYLKRAHELDPDNVEVRLALVGTKFEAEDIDLLAIRELGEYIANTSKSAAKAGTSGEYVCSFDGDPANYARFDYTESAVYRRLKGLVPLFREANELLSGVDLATAELADTGKARLLLLRAFTRAFMTIVDIEVAVNEVGVQLYRLSDGSLGVCADASNFNTREEAESLLEGLKSLIKCDLLPAYEGALDDLRQRNEILNASSDNVLLDVLSQAFDAMANSISADCTTSA